jgi:hypothetical protein
MGMIDEKKKNIDGALMPFFANTTQDPSLTVKLYKRSSEMASPAHALEHSTP